MSSFLWCSKQGKKRRCRGKWWREMDYNIASLSTVHTLLMSAGGFLALLASLLLLLYPLSSRPSIQTLLMAAAGFLAMLASLLLLMYTLPLASLPACSHSCCCWVPCFAGILAIAGVPTAIGDPPFSHSCCCWFPYKAGILAVAGVPTAIGDPPSSHSCYLLCWHPCCCWCILCHWLPSLLPLLLLLVSLFCCNPCCCWWTLYHWLPSLLPRLLLLLLASLLLLANVSLLTSSAVANLI